MRQSKNNIKKLIDLNIKQHEKIYRNYESIHLEIFNSIEQNRIYNSLKQCKKLISTKDNILTALDFGSGTGNLSKHLLAMGFEITCADISKKLLNLIKEKFHKSTIHTLIINGENLNNIKEETFNFVGCYSVLHHVPDYLLIVNELIRVCKKGGVIYIDHEKSSNYYIKLKEFQNFYKKISIFDIKKYLNIYNYINKFKSFFKKRYTNEGDLHVWTDDNIDWDKIIEILKTNNCEIIYLKDYLAYSNNYDYQKFTKYKDDSANFDTRMLIARKK